MPNIKPVPVEFDELLAAEYNYIAQTAIQANEDRARVSSFYLIAVGSLVAAIFSTQLFDPHFFTQTIDLMFSGLFILLTFLGTSTITQLARLRMAWYESVLAMSQIKDYMISRNKGLAKALRWQTDTLPSKHKRDSISFYQAIEVALISGLMFGTAVFFAQQAFFLIGVLHWVIAVLLGGLTIYLQILVYRKTIK